MSEYAIVKSFLSCLSSSFVFSLNLNKDRTYVRLIVDNLRQAIDYQGLSASTEELLYNVIEHLKSFVEGYIDSTQLDFLIDETRREIWRTKDCGIRVFVARPNVFMAVVMSYDLLLLSLYLSTTSEGPSNPGANSVINCQDEERTSEKVKDDCKPVNSGFELSPLSIAYTNRGSLLTAKSLVIHHEQLSCFNTSTQADCKIKATKTTKISYSRKEILDCNSLLFPMPEFSVSVWLMGIVKPPDNIITPPATPTSPNFSCLLPGYIH